LAGVAGPSGGKGGSFKGGGSFSGIAVGVEFRVVVGGIMLTSFAGTVDTGERSVLVGIGGLISGVAALRLPWKLSGCAAAPESRPGKAPLSVPPTG
jgi:hypothetical protein